MDSLDFDFSFVNSNYDKAKAEERRTYERREEARYTIRPEQTRRPDERYNRDGDSYRSNRPSSNQSSGLKKRLIAFLLAGIAAASVFEYVHLISDMPNYPTNEHSISEISNFTGINEDVILMANKLKSSDPVPNKIKMPEKYEVFAQQISSIEKKLKDSNLSEETRKELEAELISMQELQDKQNETAELYVTKNQVFIVPKSTVKAETLKEIFGISDGVITKYNNIGPYTFESGEHGESYKDYSNAYVQEGQVIVIPANELK